MSYTLHQLQVFLKVAEKQSVTKAAEELFMTQPAVSIQLKKFQDQFDIPLTQVVGRKLVVTDFGLEICKMATRVIHELEAIKFKTSAYQGLLSGKLSISSASTGKYVIPYFLTDFLGLHPGIDLILDVTNRARVIESLDQLQTEFALVSLLPNQMDVHEFELVQNKLYLIGNSPDSLDNLPLIYRESGSATRAAMETYFGEHPGSRRKMELTSNEAVKQAVLAGLGISIMPLIGIQHELNAKRLFILPAPDLPITTQWRLIWRKDRELSPVGFAFLELLKENHAFVVNKHFSWLKDYK